MLSYADLEEGLRNGFERQERVANLSSLDFSGLPELPQESIGDRRNMVKNICSVFNCEIDLKDVVEVKRIATSSSKKTDRPRTLVVKFSNGMIRDELLTAIRKFNRSRESVDDKFNTTLIGISGPRVPIFVGETLTPKSRHLLYLARKCKREKGYKFLWTRGGVIFMKKDESSKAIRIDTEDVFNQL